MKIDLVIPHGIYIIDHKMDRNDVMDHPYMKFIQSLNMTECYMLAIIAGDEKIIRYIPDQVTYRTLRLNFEQQYPEFSRKLRQEASKRRKHADCNPNFNKL